MEIPGISPFSNQSTLTNPLAQGESLVLLLISLSKQE